ncbi:hypothetical protein QP119_10455 [Corynebacterium frankenforstense]|uniref:hypothetical protein n=1 Tax=Corynebacterium frankenforstense TaxID=1230998 RepID=UPI00254E50A7|nr:hypothetical protein [Corynebacterium frankenforstense]MDK6260819.1 hypothetical protein [Corynebacterium frankenforstense]
MAQERFAGPEYFTEFDPERFAAQLTGGLLGQDEPETQNPETAEGAENSGSAEAAEAEPAEAEAAEPAASADGEVRVGADGEARVGGEGRDYSGEAEVEGGEHA